MGKPDSEGPLEGAALLAAVSRVLDSGSKRLSVRHSFQIEGFRGLSLNGRESRSSIWALHGCDLVGVIDLIADYGQLTHLSINNLDSRSGWKAIFKKMAQC